MRESAGRMLTISEVILSKKKRWPVSEPVAMMLLPMNLAFLMRVSPWERPV